MKCIYCKNEMDLDSQGFDNGVQFHCFVCPICLASCHASENADDKWSEPEPFCDDCGAIMGFEDELDDGSLVYVCPECYHNFVIDSVNDR